MLSQENSIIVDSVKTQFIINVNNNYVGNTHLTDIRFMCDFVRHLAIVFGVLMYFD